MRIDILFKAITIKSFKTDIKKPNMRHLFSDIHFDVKTENKVFADLSIPVSQPFGEGAIGGNVEVGTIRDTEYNLAWNHNEFVNKVEEYWAMCVGPSGRLINTSKELNMVMEDCTLGLKYTTHINAEIQGNAW